MLSCLFLAFIVGCGSSGASETNEAADTTPPILKNLSVDIEAYNSETGLAGDFNFASAKLIDANIFTSFGSVITGTTLNPTFEYKPVEGSNMVAISAGIVDSIGYDSENDDYAISVKPSSLSIWLISYDHVKNVQVSEAETISAGDAIGQVGTWYGGLGRTEIQVINQNNGLSYCPFSVFDSTLTGGYQNKITQLMQDLEEYLEEYMDDISIFDEDAMIYPGCLTETIQG